MSAVVKTAKISSRRQITLPRDVRKALGTDYVRIVSEQGSVRIEPVNDVAGSLAHYAKGRKRVPFRVVREQAWEVHVCDKRHRLPVAANQFSLRASNEKVFYSCRHPC